MIKCIVIIVMLISACKPNAETLGSNLPQGNESTLKSFSYLALGDSYTIGQSVPSQGSFPYLIGSTMKMQGWNPNPLTVIARTGWTTAELISNIEAQNPVGKFDIVSLLIGVNNQYRGYSQSEYRTEFVKLLTMALNFAGGNKTRVFVLSIPDWGITPYADGQDKAKIAKEIDEFNSINKEESSKIGVNYTDITSISRLAVNDKSLIANDGLHPSEKMYAMWADLLIPKMLMELKK